MGKETNGYQVMKRGERFVNLLCRSLTPDEREGVLGDLHECNATVWQTAHELLTLLLYRQFSCWRTWKSWFVLLCVVAPTGIVLSQIGRNINGYVVMQLWTHSHSGEWFNSALSGSQSLVAVLCICSAVALEAWCSGFAVAALSRGTLSISVFALSLIWLFQNLEWPLRSSTAWYTVALSFSLLIVPMTSGMITGSRSLTVRPRFAITLMSLVTLGMVLSIWTDGWFGSALQRWSSGGIPMQPLAVRIWPFVISALPVFYLLVQHPTSEAQG
jgi:hypothetical protein